MVESARRDSAATPYSSHLACVVNAAGAGALTMMQQDDTLLHFEGSGEELNCRHPANGIHESNLQTINRSFDLPITL